MFEFPIIPWAYQREEWAVIWAEQLNSAYLIRTQKYNPIRPVFMKMQILGRCWVSYLFTARPAICRMLFGG